MKFLLTDILQTTVTEARKKDLVAKWEPRYRETFKTGAYLDHYDDLTDFVDLVKYYEENLTNPSKYLGFVLDGIGFNPPYLVNKANRFEAAAERGYIENKDIYSPEYRRHATNDYNRLEEVIVAAEAKMKEKERTKQLGKDVSKVYEDDRWLVIVPKTHEASCHYGSGTKWCTAMKDVTKHFEVYSKSGILFYLIDKQYTGKQGVGSGSVMYKLALLWRFNKEGKPGYEILNSGNMVGYDTTDNTIKISHVWPLLPEELKASIRQYYGDVLKASRDAVSKRLEKERQEAENRRQERHRDDLSLLDDVIDKIYEGGFLNYFINQYNGKSLNMAEYIFGSRVINTTLEDGGNTGYITVDSNTSDYEIEAWLFPNRLAGDEAEPYLVEINLINDVGTVIDTYNHKLSPWANSFGFIKRVLGLDGDSSIADTLEAATRGGQNTFGYTQYQHMLSNEIINIIRNVGYRMLWKVDPYPVSEEGITYWKPTSAVSTFKFTQKGNLTSKFVDYVKENPGKTRQEFYREALNKEYTKGHNSMFFAAIKDAGIVKMERRGRQFVYTLGPTYEAWTQGKLKRV